MLGASASQASNIVRRTMYAWASEIVLVLLTFFFRRQCIDIKLKTTIVIIYLTKHWHALLSERVLTVHAKLPVGEGPSYFFFKTGKQKKYISLLKSLQILGFFNFLDVKNWKIWKIKNNINKKYKKIITIYLKRWINIFVNYVIIRRIEGFV